MNKTNHNPVNQHYDSPQLFENILAALQNKGLTKNTIHRTHLSSFDEFHVRGAVVSKELAKAGRLNGHRVLDVGCGLGGPCRMLADEFSCQVTGIDLNATFVKTARQLSKLVNLYKQTTFLQANALVLPFANGTFDAVWTQHVQMNIANKRKFYAEIHRVLAKGGLFIYYDVFKYDENSPSPTFPVPWAHNQSINFLITSSNMQQILADLSFQKEKTTDQTELGITFFDKLLARTKKQGIQKLSLQLLMGSNIQLKLENLQKSLKNKNIKLESGIYRKK